MLNDVHTYYRFLVSLFHIHVMGIEASAFTRFFTTLLCFALLYTAGFKSVKFRWVVHQLCTFLRMQY